MKTREELQKIIELYEQTLVWIMDRHDEPCSSRAEAALKKGTK